MSMADFARDIGANGHGETFSEQKRYGEPMKLCLCSRCAGAFYSLSDHVAQRVDHDQLFKGRCDYCSQINGYDYLIYERK